MAVVPPEANGRRPRSPRPGPPEPADSVGRVLDPEGRPAIELSGTWRAAPTDDNLRRAATDPDYDDDGWAPIEVPGHWRSTPAFADEDGPVLHRRRFATDDAEVHADDRAFLVVDGVFSTADVWLDGDYLGDVEGSFFPHQLEVTEQLAGRRQHCLAVEVACPRPDGRAKRQLTGLFQQSPFVDEAWSPAGLWRPLRIERSGPVRIAGHRVLCTRADASSATVAVRTVLDAAEATTVRLRTTGAGVTDLRDQPLAAGRNEVAWTVDVDDPDRWWPWALGDQPRHEVAVEVRLPDGRTSDRCVRRVGFRSLRWHDWVLHVNGERLFLKGTNLLPSRTALAEADPALLAGDVAAARDLGLDLVRVHAHVTRPEVYDAADEAGMLVWQDLPLQGGYQRSVRREARRQAAAMVDLLGHHPSVAVWCAHDRPMAVDTSPEVLADPTRRRAATRRLVAAQLLPTWNKTVLDRTVSSALEHADGTRPVVPHAGVLPHRPRLDGSATDLFVGWHHGDERDLPDLLRRWPRLARFVGALGAQAVPDDAAFLHPERWPDLDWDEARRRFGLDVTAMVRAVPPAGFATFAAWQEATQRYQALVLRHQVDELRRRKWRPCGGFAQLALAAGHPTAGFSVLDHERRPTLGHAALAAACRPIIVVADRLPAVVAPGQHLELEVHAVSDARIAHSDMVTSVQLSWRSAPPTAGPAWLELAEVEQADPDPDPPNATVWRWTGDLPPDSCVRVGTVAFDVPAEADGGLAVLDVRLEGGDVVAANRYAARVRRAPEGEGTV